MDKHVCPWWLAYTFDHPLRSIIHNPKNILGELIQKGHTVMDIGCGMGFFSIAMARLVGEEGLVISVDLQPEMLRVCHNRAKKAGIHPRIRCHLCTPNKIGVSDPVDFALAFGMVHEVPNEENFFKEVLSVLKPDAHLLLAEPIIHVPLQRFKKIVKAACSAGLKPFSEPKIKICRAVLFTA